MKREKYEPVLKNISYFIKWAEGAIVIGIVSGCIGTAFGNTFGVNNLAIV